MTQLSYLHNWLYQRDITVSEQQKTIGERLARLRKERGITQKEMAKLLEVTQSMVSDYENGVFRIHGDLIIKISKILKTSAD